MRRLNPDPYPNPNPNPTLSLTKARDEEKDYDRHFDYSKEAWKELLQEMHRLGLLDLIYIKRANGEHVPFWELQFKLFAGNPYRGEPGNNNMVGRPWVKPLKEALKDHFRFAKFEEHKRGLGTAIPAPTTAEEVRLRSRSALAPHWLG